MTQYATQAQLEAYTGKPAPEEADRLLQRASDLLDSCLITWRYKVDANDLPTDTQVITAFADCVCAQVEWWMNNQDELGEMEQFETIAFEGYTQSRGGSAHSRLAPRARERLKLVATPYLTRGILA